jgi:RimJ/RimL family protein N-acetyltransferase
MRIENILTERLLLIPFTHALTTSILEGNLEVLRELGINIKASWPDNETIETLPRILRNLEWVEEPSGFESWLIVKQDEMVVIGDAGFKGRPNANGVVDIGYAIIEEERRKGYGFEVAKRLTDWAFDQPGVKYMTGKCLIENVASARILEKLGMEEIFRDSELIYWRMSGYRYKVPFQKEEL